MINPAQLGKVYIQDFAPNNPKKLCSMVVNNNIFGNLTLETRKYEEYTFKFITELKNTKGKLLGKEIFSLDPNNKKLQGFFIEIAPEYRKKHFKFGELLRLSSIIEMLENRMSKLEGDLTTVNNNINTINQTINQIKEQIGEPEEGKPSVAERLATIEEIINNLIDFGEYGSNS